MGIGDVGRRAKMVVESEGNVVAREGLCRSDGTVSTANLRGSDLRGGGRATGAMYRVLVRVLWL